MLEASWTSELFYLQRERKVTLACNINCAGAGINKTVQIDLDT